MVDQQSVINPSTIQQMSIHNQKDTELLESIVDSALNCVEAIKKLKGIRNDHLVGFTNEHEIALKEAKRDGDMKKAIISLSAVSKKAKEQSNGHDNMGKKIKRNDMNLKKHPLLVKFLNNKKEITRFAQNGDYMNLPTVTQEDMINRLKELGILNPQNENYKEIEINSVVATLKQKKILGTNWKTTIVIAVVFCCLAYIAWWIVLGGNTMPAQLQNATAKTAITKQEVEKLIVDFEKEHHVNIWEKRRNFIKYAITDSLQLSDKDEIKAQIKKIANRKNIFND